MGISNKWIEMIYRAATGRAWKRGLLTPIGFTFFFAVMILYVFAALYLDHFIAFPSIVYQPWSAICATILILIGIFFTVWSAMCFFMVKGTPVPFNPPPRLVTKGPYAYSRNPMLTGLFLQLFGAGFLLNSFSLAFIFTPLFIILNIAYLKQIEEPELVKRLGDEYSAYRKKIPMFLPLFTSRSKKK